MHVVWMTVAGDNAEVAVADRISDAQKRMKAIGWPEMDADALASSYLIKVQICINKWSTKIMGLEEDLKTWERNEKVKKSFAPLQANFSVFKMVDANFPINPLDRANFSSSFIRKAHGQVQGDRNCFGAD